MRLLAERTGRTPEELLYLIIQQVTAQVRSLCPPEQPDNSTPQESIRLEICIPHLQAIFERIRGLWEERTDLPELAELRAESNRYTTIPDDNDN